MASAQLLATDLGQFQFKSQKDLKPTLWLNNIMNKLVKIREYDALMRYIFKTYGKLYTNVKIIQVKKEKSTLN